MKYEAIGLMNGCRATWLTTVEGEEYLQLLELYSQDVQKNQPISGFRKGKAPLSVAAAAYGERFYTDAAEALMPALYNRGGEDNGFTPVAQPTIQVIACSQDLLCFRTDVDVYPRASLGRYRGLEAERPEDSVTEEELQEEIEKFREYHREVLPAEKQEREDDLVYISLRGELEGKPFPGGTLAGVLQRFDSKDLYPGLKDRLRGCKPGDVIRYETLVPADDPRQEIAGRRVTLNIKVEEVKERRLRLVDDALFPPAYASLADFKEKKGAELHKIKKMRADEAFDANLRAALLEQLTVNIPDSMISQETGRLLENLSKNLNKEGGITAYLKKSGLSAEELGEKVKKLAIDELKLMLALDAVAEAEGIEEPDDEKREKAAFAVVKESAVRVPSGK